MNEDVSPKVPPRPPDIENGGKRLASKRLRLEGNSSVANVDLTGMRFDPNDQNRFALFAGLEVESMIPSTSTARSKNDNNPDVKLPQANNGTFCPPIFLHNVNIKSIVEQLQLKNPNVIFKIKKINRTKSKLYFADPSAHLAMLQTLRDHSVQAYSFTPKDLKQVSLIIRSLYNGIDVEKVKMALDEKVPETVVKVVHFTTPHSLKMKYDTGLLRGYFNLVKHLVMFHQ